MRELEVLRAIVEHAARTAIGTNTYVSRRTEANAHAGAMEAHLARLPVDVENLESLQDLDSGSPTYNAFYVMLDFSQLDGDDILA